MISGDFNFESVNQLQNSQNSKDQDQISSNEEMTMAANCQSSSSSDNGEESQSLIPVENQSKIKYSIGIIRTKKLREVESQETKLFGKKNRHCFDDKVKVLEKNMIKKRQISRQKCIEKKRNLTLKCLGKFCKFNDEDVKAFLLKYQDHQVFQTLQKSHYPKKVH